MQSKIISINGCKIWTEGGLFHRDFDPAIEFDDGSCGWMQNGLIHRSGGLPAIERADGTKEWWINGIRQK